MRHSALGTLLSCGGHGLRAVLALAMLAGLLVAVLPAAGATATAGGSGTVPVIVRERTGKHIGADDLWTAGITGRGVDVALVDTGVVPVQGLAGPGKVVNGPDLSFESQSPALCYLDTNGHGTHMGGIIAGQDDGEFTDISQVITAIDWVVQHRDDDGLNLRVLNLSFGTDGAQDYLLDPLTYAVDVAWRKGIVVVVAAGNRGPEATRLDNPAYDPRVLAVGADLVAPGRSIVGLRNPGSNVDLEHP